MIEIQGTLISEEIFKEHFVCDLKKCKGACCVEGDAGAPLEKQELQILEEIYPKVKPYLRAEGIQAIEEQGLYTVDEDGDYVTPLVNGGECAFVVFEKGVATCAIEKAFLENQVSFRKPVSCHLYPIRITSYKTYDAVNYHHWSVCSDACKLGNSLQVKIYRFLKAALIRKYGEMYYKQLEEADLMLNPASAR